MAFLLLQKKLYTSSCATPKKDFSMESALKTWPSTSPSPPWQVLDGPFPCVLSFSLLQLPASHLHLLTPCCMKKIKLDFSMICQIDSTITSTMLMKCRKNSWASCCRLVENSGCPFPMRDLNMRGAMPFCIPCKEQCGRGRWS